MRSAHRSTSFISLPCLVQQLILTSIRSLFAMTLPIFYSPPRGEKWQQWATGHSLPLGANFIVCRIEMGQKCCSLVGNWTNHKLQTHFPLIPPCPQWSLTDYWLIGLLYVCRVKWNTVLGHLANIFQMALMKGNYWTYITEHLQAR